MVAIVVPEMSAHADACDRAIERIYENQREYEGIVERFEIVMNAQERRSDSFRNLTASAQSDQTTYEVFVPEGDFLDHIYGLAETIVHLRDIVVEMARSRQEVKDISRIIMNSCFTQ